MTARNEKPSEYESSTDTLIEALGIIANLLEVYDKTVVEAQAVREAAQRLDKLERELEQLRKDAGRYQWLRNQHWESSPFCVVRNPKSAVKLGHDCPSAERLDKEIDSQLDQVK